MALLARHVLLPSSVLLALFEKIVQSRPIGWHLLLQLLIFLHEHIVLLYSRFLLDSIVLLMVKTASQHALQSLFLQPIKSLSFVKISVLLLTALGMVSQ